MLKFQPNHVTFLRRPQQPCKMQHQCYFLHLNILHRHARHLLTLLYDAHESVRVVKWIWYHWIGKVFSCAPAFNFLYNAGRSHRTMTKLTIRKNLGCFAPRGRHKEPMEMGLLQKAKFGPDRCTSMDTGASQYFKNWSYLRGYVWFYIIVYVEHYEIWHRRVHTYMLNLAHIGEGGWVQEPPKFKIR